MSTCPLSSLFALKTCATQHCVGGTGGGTLTRKEIRIKPTSLMKDCQLLQPLTTFVKDKDLSPMLCVLKMWVLSRCHLSKGANHSWGLNCPFSSQSPFSYTQPIKLCFSSPSLTSFQISVTVPGICVIRFISHCKCNVFKSNETFYIAWLQGCWVNQGGITH